MPPDPLPELTGVAGLPVLTHDANGLRVWRSEVANPETLTEGVSRKAAEGKYRQVLRELVAQTTTLAFPFPAMVESGEAIEGLLGEQGAAYTEALTRLSGMVQYELTATWADDERTDLATPVSGREYQKRRQEVEARAAAIDQKLKTVSAGIVREWRSRQERRTRIWYALMARGDRERFIAALRSAGPSEGVRLRLSGPWPPNEFAGAQATDN
jgi:Gas vesicle synthesis protein GvpL/GvpF